LSPAYRKSSCDFFNQSFNCPRFAGQLQANSGRAAHSRMNLAKVVGAHKQGKRKKGSVLDICIFTFVAPSAGGREDG
jgi:hypothetical protein